ncbi:hypothetical protein ABT160_18700 [Streptomyces sp. NPDC001941]|uniref:hypothetical protein n=1 Tax=Streptomyces sp. NPDC001941 TaxID=3154659 RepID=UPI0033288725
MSLDQLSTPGTDGEPTCELDPVTWDAFVDALKRHGVDDDTLSKACHDALRAINSTPAWVREQWLATGADPRATGACELPGTDTAS